jgi:hypothetical protein
MGTLDIGITTHDFAVAEDIVIEDLDAAVR